MLLVLASLLFSSASAQDAVTGGSVPELNVQTFRPAMDSEHFFRLVDPAMGREGFGARGFLSYMKSPLVYTWQDGSSEDIISNVINLDAVGTYTIDAFRIGVNVPLILRSFGGTAADVTGLGDMFLEGKVQALDEAVAPVGLAFAARTALPTSTAEGALGSTGLGLDLIATVARPVTEQLRVALEMGYSHQPSIDLENVQWGSLAHVAAGLSWALDDTSGLVAELHASGATMDFANPKARPAELLLGGWFLPASLPIHIRPALALGLSQAVTTPQMRALVTVGWGGTRPAPDADGDGIPDADDLCPNEPEDMDGYEDHDGCPELATVVVDIKDTDGLEVEGFSWSVTPGDYTGGVGDSVELDSGTHTFVVNDVEDVEPVLLEVPGGGEVQLTLAVPAPRGLLTVQAVEPGGQAIEEAKWSAKGPTAVQDISPSAVSVRPGDYHVTASAPGYRRASQTVLVEDDAEATLVLQLTPAQAELTRTRIDIKDSVYFETARAVVKPESTSLLDEIAEILQDHTEITRLGIEGHTDSRGGAESNLRLSQARADAVKQYLEGKGVATERLEATGYGESRPLVKERTSADRSRNRRVDFVVLERSDDHLEGPTKLLDTQGDEPKEQ